MKNLNVLIKPASSKCNLKCKYCFYEDVSLTREIKDYSLMSIDTSHKIIDNIFSDKELKFVSIGFQGGEPTLAGIDFFKDFFEYVSLKKGDVKVEFSMQTNGIILNEQWINLFKKYDVLIGLSLDGPAKIHNQNRIDLGGGNTHSKVINAVKLLNEGEVKYNVLVVVSGETAKNIDKIYNYLVGLGITHLQFIPLLKPIDYKVKNIYKLNDVYFNYLNQLFKVWLKDYNEGKIISIRMFDNILNMMMGYAPESCDMRGSCSIQNVIEADGSTFACDFFALDEYCIGNSCNDSFVDMLENDIAVNFIKTSLELPDQCQSCEIYNLCRNGCKRMRADGKYIYCQALKDFYRKNGSELKKIALQIKRA